MVVGETHHFRVHPHMFLRFSSLSPPFCPYTPNSADPRPEMVNRPVTMAFEEGFQSALHAMHPGRWVPQRTVDQQNADSVVIEKNQDFF